MAREEETRKTTDELIERAWKIAHAANVATLITVDAGKAIARPMSPRIDADSHVIHFLTSVESRKVQQADAGHADATVFVSHGNGYVSFIGTLSISNDRAKIRELWSAFDKAWWESPDDPSIRLATFCANEAELWDGPNKLAAAALMLSAAVTGSKPKLGDHAQLPAR